MSQFAHFLSFVYFWKLRKQRENLICDRLKTPAGSERELSFLPCGLLLPDLPLISFIRISNQFVAFGRKESLSSILFLS